jgi:hypothetical protein
MAKQSYAAPLLAREGIEAPEWSGEIDVTRFEGLRDHSLQQALEQIAKLGPRALDAWEKEAHPPTVDIYPDAIGVFDGRHRMLAAASAGVAEMPVRVRKFDENGVLISSFHQIALLRPNAGKE